VVDKGYVQFIAANAGCRGRPRCDVNPVLPRSALAVANPGEEFFETLFLENKENNIRTSVIIPGRVRTSISLHALNSEGKEFGKMDTVLAKGLPPEKAARIIIRGIIRNRREILVGRSELIMLYIRRIWPWLFFRIAGKIKST